MKYYNNITELIGKTPVLKLNRIMEEKDLPFNLFGKLEMFNPGGSAKDRVGFNMIKDAEKRGIIKPGATIIEPTSGNTGIGLALAADALGYKAIIVMPDSMSVERINLMKAYGAELILTPGAEGMSGSIKKAEELNKEIPGSWIAGQFDNPANSEIHYLTTGPELYDALDGKIDAFVAGIGTGGTITGVGRYLKEKNPEVKIIGVEPASSPLLTEGHAGPHGLQGIGANFVPSVLDTEIYDEIITITEAEAYEMGKAMAFTEGVLVGITSGANIAAALKIGARPEFEGKNVVAFITDTGERYLSTPMFK